MLILQSILKNPFRLAVGVLFLALYVVGDIQAQEATDRQFNPYLSAGLTSSQISGDQLRGFDQLGVNLGLGIELELNSQWRPRMEIQFDQRGSRKNARPDEGDLESYLLRLNYVQVPLSIGYLNGKTGFELGIAPAYLLSLNEENEFGSVEGLGREFKSYDLSGLAGIRYRFHESWELSTRFAQSFIPVRDHGGGATFRLNQGQYNSSVQFSLRFHV